MNEYSRGIWNILHALCGDAVAKPDGRTSTPSAENVGHGKATEREVVGLSAKDLEPSVRNFESPDSVDEFEKMKMTRIDFGPMLEA